MTILAEQLFKTNQILNNPNQYPNHVLNYAKKDKSNLTLLLTDYTDDDDKLDWEKLGYKEKMTFRQWLIQYNQTELKAILPPTMYVGVKSKNYYFACMLPYENTIYYDKDLNSLYLYNGFNNKGERVDIHIYSPQYLTNLNSPF